MRSAKQFGRIAASVAVLAGSSWLTVNFLERKLSQLIADATVIALQDPDVYDDIFALCEKLLTNLLSNEATKEETVQFLGELLKEQSVEIGLIDMTINAMNSDHFKSNYLEFQQELAHQVIGSSDLEQKLLKMVRGGTLPDRFPMLNLPALKPDRVHFLELPKFDGHMQVKNPTYAKAIDYTKKSLSFQSLVEQAQKLSPVVPVSMELEFDATIMPPKLLPVDTNKAVIESSPSLSGETTKSLEPEIALPSEADILARAPEADPFSFDINQQNVDVELGKELDRYITYN